MKVHLKPLNCLFKDGYDGIFILCVFTTIKKNPYGMFLTHLHLIYRFFVEKSEGHETLAFSSLISL